MRIPRYTNEQFIEAVKTSNSYSEVMRKIGLRPVGGNHSTIKRKILLLNLDTSHFTFQSWVTGKKFPHKRPIQDYLNNKIFIKSHALKLRLIKEGYFIHQCYDCGLKIWKNQPIPLELHHIDGDHYNNSLDNLQLLCPNCHSFTENYGGKNSICMKKNKCKICSKPILASCKHCHECWSNILRQKLYNS